MYFIWYLSWWPHEPTTRIFPYQVFWFRDSEVIQPSEHIHLNQVNGQNSGQLEIPNTTEADYGQYKCTAENALGRETFTFDLTGSSAGNSAIKVMLCLKDVFGMFVVISFASLKLAWLSWKVKVISERSRLSLWLKLALQLLW